MWFPFVFHGTLSAVSVPDSETLLSLPNGFFVTVPAQENSHCFLKLGGEELECYYENFSCQTCLATEICKCREASSPQTVSKAVASCAFTVT